MLREALTIGFVPVQVLEYFKTFADEFDLRRHIRLRTAVLSAEYLVAADHPNGAHVASGDVAARVESNGATPAAWRVTSAPLSADGTPAKVPCIQRVTISSLTPKSAL